MAPTSEIDARGPLLAVTEFATLLAQGAPIVVLDVRYRVGVGDGREQYVAGHVPGAAYVDLDHDLAAPALPDRRGGRHPLPQQGDFEGAMRRAGVRDDSRVVVYDDWGGRAAARAWWLLGHHGHDRVQVLDGGWSAWCAAGGAVESGSLEVAPGDFHAMPGRWPVVDAEALAGFAGSVVDARAPERFRGEVEPLDPVAGHVPGAVNVPTEDNLRSDGTFAAHDDLAERYPAGAVAAYCGSGVTACHDLLALAVLGRRGTLYAGSWSDWVSDPGRPVATGD